MMWELTSGRDMDHSQIPGSCNQVILPFIQIPILQVHTGFYPVSVMVMTVEIQMHPRNTKHIRRKALFLLLEKKTT